MRRPALWIPLAALAFAACGGSDDSADPEPEPEPTDAAETTADDDPEPDPEPEPEPGEGDAPSEPDDGAAAPETTEAPSGPSTATSDDGLLQLELPAGSPEVTITPTTPIDGVDTGSIEFETIATYDLGPDGTTFDEPVIVDFALPDSIPDHALIMVLHRDDDGIEALDLEFTETGLRTSLDSFSEFEVVANDAIQFFGEPSTGPDQLDDGPLFLEVKAALEDGEAIGSIAPITVPFLYVDESQEQFECVDPSAETVKLEIDVPPLEIDDFYVAHVRDVSDRLTIDCPVEGTPIEATDVRFIDRSTGNPVEPFLSDESLTPTVAVDRDDSTITIDFDVPIEMTTTLGTGGPTADGSFRYIEANREALIGFFGNNFANYTPDPGFATVERTDLGNGIARDSFTISVPCGADGMSRTFPGGTPADGSPPIGPVDVMINDFSGFIETADGLQATISIDPTSGPATAVDGLSTCP